MSSEKVTYVSTRFELVTGMVQAYLMGATGENVSEVKVFRGSSTGEYLARHGNEYLTVTIDQATGKLKSITA